MINNIIIKEILKDLNVVLERSNEIIDGDLYCLDLFFNRATNLCCEKCGSIALPITKQQ